MAEGVIGRRRSRQWLRYLRGPIALVTAIAFVSTSMPLRMAHANPEQVDAAETPNFSENHNGVRAGGDDASSTAKKTKSRKAPVSATGAFAHSIEIQLPPGRLGMTPSLALSYSSGSTAESAVGVGWSFGTASIARSTRLGFPKVTADAPRIYDDAAGIFTGPSGEMVPAVDGPDGVANVFAPSREASPVRYQHDTNLDAWVEHDPSGTKRYFGRDPVTGYLGKITNELGTHAWLLMREVDEYGNFIAYRYHNESEIVRSNRRAAQRTPILSEVQWGGHQTGSQVDQPSSFFAQTYLSGSEQLGPVNLLDGNTILRDSIARIDVRIDTAVQWSYTLHYATSPTGKLLLSAVSRGGDAPETTTFTYSGATPPNPRFEDMGEISSANPATDPIYTNNSRGTSGMPTIEGLDPAIFWQTPARANAVMAVQAPAFRSGVKFIDVDGNGTTDAIYHAAGIGTTATHVLWEDSSLQAPSSNGLGAWTVPAPGNPSVPSTQPDTGLPYFPFNGSWERSDFATAALQDLADLDGDGDADGIALPFRVGVTLGPNVWVPPHTTHALPEGPAGTLNLRTFTNTARSSTVTHVPAQQLAHWPVDSVWSFTTQSQESSVVVTNPNPSAPPGTLTPLSYKVEPVNDLQLPLVDLNADGKLDLVLLKRRRHFANFVPPGAPPTPTQGIGAYTLPIGALLRMWSALPGQPTASADGPSTGGAHLEDRVRHFIGQDAIVLTDEALLAVNEEPTLFGVLVTTAGELQIPELAPTRMMVMMSAPGGIPMPGIPGGPVPEDFGETGFKPPRHDEPYWWLRPQVDPWGDVWLPLRDHYYLGGGWFGFRMFYGSFRFVPRVYMTRGSATRAFESERTEDSSAFEVSLRDHLNDGSENECTSMQCAYPPHVNFNSFFSDLNGDGLPDLVVASRPDQWTDPANGYESWKCADGHDVYLNRGYAFESTPNEVLSHGWTAGPLVNMDMPFNQTANRDRICSTTRPRIDDNYKYFPSTLPTFPSAAMAQADLDGDGRVDIVLAHQQAFTGTIGAPVVQKVYRNTGRGFEAWPGLTLPADVAVSRNFNWAAPTWQAGWGSGEWPRAGTPDRARFVDLDNDGLVDIAVSGQCAKIGSQLQCDHSRWYRNIGEIPDRLVRVSSTTGAWTTIDYASPKSGIITVPPGGLHPPASTRVVSVIKSAAGPVPTPAGYDPFPVEEIRLSYENYVKDLVNSESLGFEKVVATFVNSFDNAPRETVRVTRTFDVRPNVLDSSGAPIAFRHPLKGALLSTVTQSEGWTATDLNEYFVAPYGDGVRIRPMREVHGDTSSLGETAWSSDETIERGAFGFPTRRISGNFDGGNITSAGRREVTLEYENRTATWQLGLVTREQSFGYHEDIAGTPSARHVLSDVQTAYTPQGAPDVVRRIGIRGGDCAGPDYDATAFEYLPNGLVQAVHEMAVHDPDTGATHNRDRTTTYDPKSLYAASVTVKAGKLVGGVFTPAATTLTASYETDLRTGNTTKARPPSGAATIATYDSRGRQKSRSFLLGTTTTPLSTTTYGDAFPLSRSDTIVTDGTKQFTVTTLLDADGNDLAAVRLVGTQYVRKSKQRYDAFGRVVETFHPRFVASVAEGFAPDPSGIKDVATFDGFDRLLSATDAAGATRSFGYKPREVFETNPRDVPTRRAYDAFGDIVALERNPGGAASNHSLHTFVRDGRGEILSVTDDDGSIRRFERDGGGRLLYATLPTAPGATPTTFALCHDVDDKLVSIESPHGRSVEVFHDELGRTLLTQGIDANGLYVESTQKYDDTGVPNGLGRLTQRTDESGTYRFVADAFGFPAQQIYTPSVRAKAGATNVASSYGANYTYTPTGALKQAYITGLTKAATILYSLDNAGRTAGVLTRVGTFSPTVVASSLVYDAADRLTSARYANGHQTYWTYNPLSERLDRIEYRNGSGAIHSAVSYGYDANSNITREDRYKLNIAGVWRQKLHDYDALDRLQVTSFQTSSGTTAQSFTYTGSGNIQQAGYQAYSYDASASSQAASLIEDSATGSLRTLVYDNDGYLANDRTTNADGSRSARSFAFDPMGCMRSIRRDELSPFGELTSSAASDYTCGPGGRVVARSTILPTGGLSRRIDFAGLAEIRPDDGILLLRIPVGGTVTYEDARSLPAGDSVSAHRMYMVSDIRGSLIAATSWASGQADVMREAEFDGWGQKLTNYTALASPKHGFDGAEADAAVGTYSFGARTYDPSLRRWLSPDPMIAAAPGIDEDSGHNLNLYAFAGNNPIARIDLTGFEEQSVTERASQLARRAANHTPAAIVGRQLTASHKIGGQTWTWTEHAKALGNAAVQDTVAARAANAAGHPIPTVKGDPKDLGETTGKIGYALASIALSAGEAAVAKAEAKALKLLTKPDSRALGKALEAAGQVRPPDGHAHHIVAGKIAAAEPARQKLVQLGIGINEAANGTFLPAPAHRALHSSPAYIEAVNSALSSAKTREEGVQVLKTLADQIQAGAF